MMFNTSEARFLADFCTVLYPSPFRDISLTGRPLGALFWHDGVELHSNLQYVLHMARPTRYAVHILAGRSV